MLNLNGKRGEAKRISSKWFQWKKHKMVQFNVFIALILLEEMVASLLNLDDTHWKLYSSSSYIYTCTY